MDERQIQQVRRKFAIELLRHLYPAVLGRFRQFMPAHHRFFISERPTSQRGSEEIERRTVFLDVDLLRNHGMPKPVGGDGKFDWDKRVLGIPAIEAAALP